jgi:hypothetical protein
MGWAAKEHSKVGLSLGALREAGLCGSQLVEVTALRSNQTRLARIFAIDAESEQEFNKAESSRLDGPDSSERDVSTNPGFPHVVTSLGSSGADAHTAYLSPLLAYNLGLLLHLRPFLAKQAGSEEASHASNSTNWAKTNTRTPSPSSHLEPPSFSRQARPPTADILIRPYRTRSSGPKDIAVSESSRALHPPVASHARIAQIRVPASAVLHQVTEDERADSEAAVDAALAEYFSEPQLLCPHDVFVVQVADPLTEEGGAPAKWAEEASVKSDKNSVVPQVNLPTEATPITRPVYFTVESLDPTCEPFLTVQADHTALVLVGSTNHAVPPGIGTNGEAFPPVPVSAAAVADIARLLAPILHPAARSLHLRTAVLLLGPPGVGKRSAVRAAAEVRL